MGIDPIADIDTAESIAQEYSISELMHYALLSRRHGWGEQISYSRKVFIPLTELCRDVCHYCTFAKTPKRIEKAYLTEEQVLDIATKGAEKGCKEALFTLGDKPELRYPSARDALSSMGYASTIDYLESMAQLVIKETGLLPHLNPGVLSLQDYQQLRSVAPSMGIMLESSSLKLCEKGGPHFGSPDKLPQVRLNSIAAAGKAKVPLTSGILIGIGESRHERLVSLFELRKLHDQYNHIQEIIIQNFIPKPGTQMSHVPAASADELVWSIAMARLIFGPDMSIQTPPNLNLDRLDQVMNSGINDWGGVSPVTPDHVNPESPWPNLTHLTDQTKMANASLVERLTVYPSYIADRQQWIDPKVIPHVLNLSDASGMAREDGWSAGSSKDVKTERPPSKEKVSNRLLNNILDKARDGELLSFSECESLFDTRDEDVDTICLAADELRRQTNGNAVTYVVNRNINYTNLCTYNCHFCAFSKGKISETLREAPYLVEMREIARRTSEARDRGATEVCLQGGIHPSFTGETYLEICDTVRRAEPSIHIHAFSPLEVWHGASTLNLSVRSFLKELKKVGLNTLPGTAAEILDDQVRQQICPDKISSDQWIDVMREAHKLGIYTTSTMMFGHVEQPISWVKHLFKIFTLQKETRGFREFVPLPFVHMEAPIYRRGRARPGPTFREVRLIHAVARLTLNPVLSNIQVSWVKLGKPGVIACLNGGANDLGGTLMNESISRAAGSQFGQELSPLTMDELIRSIDRIPQHRNTNYKPVNQALIQKSYQAGSLLTSVNLPARDYERL